MEQDVVGAREQVYEGGRFAIGRFRCSPAHPRFADSGPAGNYLLVFPRVAVQIAHEGRPAVIADPTRVMFYNRGQRYRRRALVPEGDRCEWFGYDASCAADVLGEPRGRDERIFVREDGPADARTFALQRALYEHVHGEARPEPLLVEEMMMLLLARACGATSPPPPSPRARHDELVAHARLLLAQRFTERLPLTTLARTVGCSPFHLVRLFRARVGLGLHAYQLQLRLRRALDPIAAGDDLTMTALELGFSSHAHFTAAFRHAFGVPPSALRLRASASRVRRLAALVSGTRASLSARRRGDAT